MEPVFSFTQHKLCNAILYKHTNTDYVKTRPYLVSMICHLTIKMDENFWIQLQFVSIFIIFYRAY
jgi:hypothetical protein